MPRMVLAVALAGAMLSMVALAPAARAATNVLFILDSSGSMWEKVDGTAKTVTAKRVLGETLGSLPADARVGLMTYGHRRKGDCRDIELLSPIGAESRQAIAKKVNALKPKGETPIATALDMSADAFKGHAGERNMIVLITDGAEECHGDPCAAAKRLAAAGFDVHINVVGFNLKQKERDAVECVAREGHGKYYDARDSKALSAAMTEVKAQVAQAAPAPAPPAPPPPPEPNLLSPSEGGQVIAAPDASWAKAISGSDADTVGTPCGGGWPVEAVFAFKDEKPATFSKFEILIPSTGNWVKDFELLVADDSPTGTYRSLGKFTTQNMRMIKSPYQAFGFPETTAKYLKVKLYSTYGGGCPGPFSQIRLVGKLAPEQAAAAPGAAAAKPDEANLLSSAEGGQLLAAPDANWAKAISGNEADTVGTPCGGWPVEAVFAFKDEKPATFSKFEILIPSAGNWVKDFELLVADDSPAGTYRSLGKFTTQNMRMIKSPYQAFSFPETTAKYLKLRLLSTSGGGCAGPLTQIRLMGKSGS